MKPMDGANIELLDEAPMGTCLKYLMIIHQVILMIVGAIALGIGIWLALWTQNINHLSFLMGYDYYKAAYVLCIIIGSTLIIISIIGCCGSQQESTCMILFVLILNILCFAVFLAIAILGFHFHLQIRTTVKERLVVVISKGYGINLQEGYYQNLTYSVDVLQRDYKCCGAFGDKNSTKSWYIYRNASAWYQISHKNGGPPYVPKSCCILRTDGSYKDPDICQGIKAAAVAGAPPITKIPVKGSNVNLYENGCYNQMSAALLYYSTMIGAVGASFFIYMFAGIVCSFALLRVLAVARFEFNRSTPEERAERYKQQNAGRFNQARGKRPVPARPATARKPPSVPSSAVRPAA